GAGNGDDASTERPQAGPGLPEFLVGHSSNQVRGQNVSLGLMLTYPKWSAGLLYQFPLSSDFKTQADQTMSGAPPPPPRAIEGTLRFPRAVGVGAAWRPATPWTVALDFTWDEWTEAVVETPTTGRISFFDGLPKELSATRDTLSVNAGAEHLFSGDGFVVPLRFGAAWEPQGYRNPYTRDPVNFVMLAAGGACNTNSPKLHAALPQHTAHPPPSPTPS